MLFGDAEEEEYTAETGNMFGFKPEDSSYSESSDPDCCSEGSDDGTQQQAVANAHFSTCNSSAEGANVTASHYCIPGNKNIHVHFNWTVKLKKRLNNDKPL